MRILFSGLLVTGLLAGLATGQRLAVYDPFIPAFNECQPPTALLPGPNPPLPPYAAAPALPPPVPFVVVPGDATFDNQRAILWYTNGFNLAAMATPTVPPLVTVPPTPIPIPAAVTGPIGGPVTGLAIDPVGLGGGPLIYLVSAPGMFVGVAPGPGLPIVVPPTPIPFPPGAPITGLEWDGATGTLWAVDITGVAYNFTPLGAPVGVPVLPAVPMPGPAGDIAIDKLNRFNAVGLRPLYVVGGPLIVDITDPTAVAFPGGPPGEGLAFVNYPAEIPPVAGCEGCPGVTAGPTAFATSVMTAGSTVFSVGMGGLVPMTTWGIFAFDTTTAQPPFPALNGPNACALGLTITPTLILAVGGPAGPAGTITTPVPLTGVVVGAYLHNQNLTFCASQPSGFAFSRFQTIRVGGL